MNRTGFSQRLEPRLSQTLIMTPQLQQAIKMLQLSNLELTDFINHEIQQNPLLERRERELGEDSQGDHVSGGEDAAPTAVPEMLTGEFAPDAAEQWQPGMGRGWRPACRFWRRAAAMAQWQRKLGFGGTSRARPDRNPVAHPARASTRAVWGRL